MSSKKDLQLQVEQLTAENQKLRAAKDKLTAENEQLNHDLFNEYNKTEYFESKFLRPRKHQEDGIRYELKTYFFDNVLTLIENSKENIEGAFLDVLKQFRNFTDNGNYPFKLKTYSKEYDALFSQFKDYRRNKKKREMEMKFPILIKT